MSRLPLITLYLSITIFLTGCNKSDTTDCSIQFNPSVVPTKSDVWTSVDVDMESGIASTNRNIPTKSSPVNDILPDGSSFGVLAYSVPDGIWNQGVVKPDIMYNKKITRQGDNYTYNNSEFWPIYPVRFYAYYPYVPDTGGNGILLPPSNQTGSPIIEFTVNDAIADQFDFMIAETRIMSSQVYVPIQFKHALTKIGFSFRTENLNGNVSVQTIEITNVQSQGLQRYNNAGIILWSSLEYNNIKNYVASTENGAIIPQLPLNNTYQQVTTPSGYLLLIPQPITANTVQITVKYSVDGNAKEYKTYIPATSSGNIGEWTAGKELNFQITLTQ